MDKRLEKVRNKERTGQYKTKSAYRMARNNVFRDNLRKKPTKAELIVKNYLDKNAEEMGIKNGRVMFQKGFMMPYHRIVDFYIPKIKIIIEVDGGYHKETIYQDARKDSVWSLRGYRTLRILNQEVYDGRYITIIRDFVK